MEVKIKMADYMLDAKIEIVDDTMLVSPIPLMEKFEPKDGDVVNVDGYISIFRNTRGSIAPAFDSHVILIDNKLSFSHTVLYGEIRPATEEEKKKLFDKLAEEGLEWNAEKKELVKLKWKPKLDEKYYHPILRPSNDNLLFEPISEICKDDIFNNIVIKKGWAFRTKDECQEFCDKLNQAINSVKP